MFFTRWYAVKTAKHIVEILSPLNCPVILVFCDRVSLRNSVRAVPNVGTKYTRNMKISQFSENKSLSLKTVKDKGILTRNYVSSASRTDGHADRRTDDLQLLYSALCSIAQ